MVIGIGIDIVKIEKMRSVLERCGQQFLEKVFNEDELAHVSEGKIYYQRIAARFAAKEAVIKALSNEYLLALKDIMILNRDNGAPFCTFKKDIACSIFLSISHIEEYAVACAVAEKRP